jgi:hypothetical protein
LLTPHEADAIRSNLFPSARHIVDVLPARKWHRDRAKNVTASRNNSSQALALDVFVTINGLKSRTDIAEAWTRHLAIPSMGIIDIEPEAEIPTTLLHEPRCTQVDVVLHGTSATSLVECKFTESDGGHCSQTVKRELKSGSSAAQCNGRYEPQRNPINDKVGSCALTAKGVKYWTWIPRVLKIDPNVEHRPCPFAGGAYQWMRNLVAARAMMGVSNLPHSFIIVYAAGAFPVARKLDTPEWKSFVNQLTGEVPIQTISFQSLLSVAKSAATMDDLSILDDLSGWVEQKVRRAAS